MPPKLPRLIKALYASSKTKVGSGGSDLMPFQIRSAHTFFNYWISGQVTVLPTNNYREKQLIVTPPQLGCALTHRKPR